MRILLMIDWFLYYTVELANALVQDHQVMLVTRDHNFEISSPDKPVDLDTFLDEVLDKRIVREKLRYRRRSPKNVSEVPRVLRSIRAFSPDVVHIQENKDWRITWIANKLGFRKTVLTVHDVAAHPGHRRQLQGYISWIPRFRAARVIVHGEFLKGFLSSRFKIQRSRIHVVPHGAFSIYNKWDDGNIREEENTVLFFGRIMKYKGLDVLIKSFPLIASEIPDIKIIIAGRGNDFSMYESMMEDRSRFEVHHRFIANVEVPKFFRRASLVVLPYTEASQSGIIPIAYSFGKPVVVTDVGSIPEVVEEGKTGLVIPPGNPEALARAIVSLLKDPKRRREMALRAKNKAETDLSWKTVARKTAEVYLSL